MAVQVKPSPRFLTALGVIIVASSVAYGSYVFLKSRESVAPPPIPGGSPPGIVYASKTPSGGQAVEAKDYAPRWGAAGEVRWIDFASRKLILLDGSDRYEVSVATGAEIKKGGQAVTLADLRVGDTVNIAASAPFNGFALEAKSVTAAAGDATPSAPSDPVSVLQ